jgi:hypothetical protein
MNYSPLVMIALKHSFYDRGDCSDFTVAPSPATAALLKNHRCIVKFNAYGLSVYAPFEDQQPVIPFAEDSPLVFGFTLKNDGFSLYTDGRIELSNPSGLQLSQKGLEVNPDQGISTTPSVHEPLFSIAIQRDFNHIKALPDTDEIRFFAKPVLWLYYLVTDPGESGEFAIADAGQDLPKSLWQRREPLPGDGIYSQLVRQYPAMAIICFVCGQPLDCRESSTRHLQLRLGEHTVFERLPNPGYRNYVHFETGAGSKPTDAIYQIVKYLTNNTLIKG